MGSAQTPQPQWRGEEGRTPRDGVGGRRRRPGGLSPPAAFSRAHPSVNNTISTWPQAGVVFIIYESPGQEGSSSLYRVCTHLGCLRGALRGCASPRIAHAPLPPPGTRDYGYLRTQGAGGTEPPQFPQVIRNSSHVDANISSPWPKFLRGGGNAGQDGRRRVTHGQTRTSPKSGALFPSQLFISRDKKSELLLRRDLPRRGCAADTGGWIQSIPGSHPPAHTTPPPPAASCVTSITLDC